ncbi:Uma2 family endonuclease [Leptolyngbya ohadii]|uniref:Uma2 family endonuclease n=1 Tax=Leptolyngbya ohadii TaxID=1962290 RepID=UPI000B5A0B39|nr:Uma2 family endonuclease [Leptolyngbya ohadii]
MSQRPTFPLQPTPPLPPRETLPTMYDLPSEHLEESGLPDEFHDLQPQLLSATLRLRHYAKSDLFTGTDLNLYYDVRHPQWYKRPDWFLVLGVSRLYDGKDLRSSYVLWQEGVDPFVVVELLSPGTEREDLGDRAEVIAEAQSIEAVGTILENGEAKPPRKWEVYEQVLRVPYYIVFSRYTNQVRFFQLVGGRYQEQAIDLQRPRVWIPELELGIGLWNGTFEGVERQWLRWYDDQGNWIPTDTERADRLAARLRELGEDPDALS